MYLRLNSLLRLHLRVEATTAKQPQTQLLRLNSLLRLRVEATTALEAKSFQICCLKKTAETQRTWRT